MLIDAEVDLAALDIGHGLGHIRGDGAGLGVGHQTARAQHAGDPAHLGHLVGCGDRGVEVQEAALDLLDQIVAADHIGAGGDGLLGLLAHREHRDAGGLAGAVRQAHGATHHLIGLTRIDAQTDRDLDGGVLFLRGRFLGEFGRFQRGVQLVLVDLLSGLFICLAVLAHFYSNLVVLELWCSINALRASAHHRAEAGPPTNYLEVENYSTVIPIDRAVPAMIFAA